MDNEYGVWLCRLCGSHPVPALATLFLMSYTKMVVTVTNALSMSQLLCNDGILTVWYCRCQLLSMAVCIHLILVDFTCCVLVIGLAYHVLVMCATQLDR